MYKCVSKLNQNFIKFYLKLTKVLYSYILYSYILYSFLLFISLKFSSQVFFFFDAYILILKNRF